MCFNMFLLCKPWTWDCPSLLMGHTHTQTHIIQKSVIYHHSSYHFFFDIIRYLTTIFNPIWLSPPPSSIRFHTTSKNTPSCGGSTESLSLSCFTSSKFSWSPTWRHIRNSSRARRRICFVGRNVQDQDLARIDALGIYNIYIWMSCSWRSETEAANSPGKKINWLGKILRGFTGRWVCFFWGTKRYEMG